MNKAIIGVAILAVCGSIYWLLNRSGEMETGAGGAGAGAPLVRISVPDVLSGNAEIGKVAFDAKCAGCHGAHAVGQDGVAPPLIHVIYEPSHHGDEAFQRAVAMGTRAHHWKFGDMPPVKSLTRADVTMILAYVREVQRANGIN